MAAPINKAHKDAILWSSHDKMLVQPLKDSDAEVRFVGVFAVLGREPRALCTAISTLQPKPHPQPMYTRL
jgi:hypothetical protein